MRTRLSSIAVSAAVVAALLATTFAPARADVMVDENAGALSGTYTIGKGVMPDRKKYKGTVQLKFTGGGENGTWETYRALWTTGAGTEANGLGWNADWKHLVLAFGSGDIAVGRMRWGEPVDGVPQIEGVFQSATTTMMFTATPTKKAKKGKYDGTWALTSDGAAIGTLTIKKVGKAFTLLFVDPSGASATTGVALANGKMLDAALAGADGGLAVYKVKSSKKGLKLEGQWAGVAGGKLGTEHLTR